MPPPLPDATRGEVERRARRGETFEAIAEATKVSKGAISAIARKAGIAVRARGARSAAAGTGPRRAAPASPAPAGRTRKPPARATRAGSAATSAKAAAAAAPGPKKAAAPADDEREADQGLPLYDPETLVGVDLEELDLSALEALERGAARLLNTKAIQADARLFVVLGDFVVKLRTSMHRLRPPPKVDPDLDPSNLHARQTVLERVRGMVAAARGRAAAIGPGAEGPPA